MLANRDGEQPDDDEHAAEDDGGDRQEVAQVSQRSPDSPMKPSKNRPKPMNNPSPVRNVRTPFVRSSGSEDTKLYANRATPTAVGMSAQA